MKPFQQARRLLYASNVNLFPPGGFLTTMRVIRNLLMAISVMALFSLGLQAQTMTLSGTVLDEKGQPLQGAQVKIDRTDMKGAYKVKTDKKGNYLYAGLPYTGVYNVTLEVNGKDVDRIQGVRQKG